jgi:phage virion morphogenesis protein
MSDDLSAVEDWAAAFLQRLAPSERRTLAGQIARELRRSQAARIAAQQNPDGSAFKARKPQKNLRDKQGAIKRGPMFAKLRLAKRLKIIEASAQEVGIGFTGRDARIAGIHQRGESDKLGNRTIAYPERRLLGFTDDDSSRLMDTVLAFLDK